MIKLKWKSQERGLTSPIVKNHLERIRQLAEKNSTLFYVSVPSFVYGHILNEGIDAKVEIMERETNPFNINDSSLVPSFDKSAVLLRISRK